MSDEMESFNFSDPRLLEVVRLLLGEEKPTRFTSLSEDDEDAEVNRAVRVKINLRLKKKQHKAHRKPPLWLSA
jgi:hypothetical protein